MTRSRAGEVTRTNKQEELNGSGLPPAGGRGLLLAKGDPGGRHGAAHGDRHLEVGERGVAESKLWPKAGVA